MPITHAFVSAVTDGSTTTEIRPSNWNAGHISTVTNSSLVFPEVLSRVTFSAATSNTSAISTLINYIVPARLLSSNRMLRWTMFADLLRGTTAVINNFGLEIFDNSSRWKSTASTLADALTTDSGLLMRTYIAALGTSGNRKMWSEIWLSSANGGTFGIGDITALNFGSLRALAWPQSSVVYTVTTGAASTFIVQFNWLAANSSLSFRMRYNVLELI